MKIAVMSDTHDNVVNMKKVLGRISEIGVDQIIHCGDLISPFIMDELQAFEKKVHVVFGYQDVNLVTISHSFEKKYSNLIFYKDFGKIEIGGRKIFIIHNNELSREIAENKKYDVVFYGHNHVAKSELVGKTLLVNPGEVLGIKGKVTFAVYDTEKNNIEIIELN